VCWHPKETKDVGTTSITSSPKLGLSVAVKLVFLGCDRADNYRPVHTCTGRFCVCSIDDSVMNASPQPPGTRSLVIGARGFPIRNEPVDGARMIVGPRLWYCCSHRASPCRVSLAVLPDPLAANIQSGIGPHTHVPSLGIAMRGGRPVSKGISHRCR